MMLIDNMKNQESRMVSNTIFGFTLAVVIVSLVGLFFPALMTSLIYERGVLIDPFELGFWVTPFLTVNLILLGFGIVYYKKILPDVILRSIKSILSFEISPRIATIVIVTLFGIYIIFSVNELTIYEGDVWPDYIRIQKALEEFPFNEYRGNESIVYVKNFILWVSHNILGNIRILPFVGSISLLLVTYFFTVQITKKRFAGIIAVIILMQSHEFLRYDTSATYSFFWTLFYLLSLYVIHNRWHLSHFLFILSLLSKPLTAVFLPMTLFFTYNAEIPRKKKILIIIPYVVILVAIVGAALGGIKVVNVFQSFDYGTFWMGLAALSLELRFEGVVLIFLLPLTVGLFLISRKGMKQADSILFLIMGTLLAQALLVALTNHNILPYRYIPMIVFFAVGVGTLFSKKITQPV